MIGIKVSEYTYAVIKDGYVTNTLVFDNPSKEIIDSFIEKEKCDSIVLSKKYCQVGGTYDGSKFWLPQPYPSWIKNEETNEWEAPVPYPTIEEGSDEKYIWDENTISWILLSQ